MKAALYTRVSTMHQVEDGESLNAQKDALTKYCKSKGYDIYKLYSDEGISGKDTEHRPALNNMLKDMRKGEFGVIVITKLDRLSRNLIDTLLLREDIKNHNCLLESVNNDIGGNDASGEFHTDIISSVAKFERRRIAERITDTFDYKVEKGYVITGSLPYGYKIGYDKDNNKIPILDEEKAFVVKEIFEKYIEWQSLNRVTVYINEKYPNLVYKGGFESICVKRIITKKQYYGEYRDNEKYYPPIITKEIWEKANKIRETKNIKSGQKHSYLFSGLLRADCGHKMAGYIHQRNHYYYRCVNVFKTHKCDNKACVRQDIIENELMRIFDRELNKYLKEIEVVPIEEKEKSKYDKNKLLDKKNKILESYWDGDITKKKKDELIKDINKKLESIVEKPKQSHEGIKELVRATKQESISKYYSALSLGSKQQFLRQFIDYIEIDLKKYKSRVDFLKIHFIG